MLKFTLIVCAEVTCLGLNLGLWPEQWIFELAWASDDFLLTMELGSFSSKDQGKLHGGRVATRMKIWTLFKEGWGQCGWWYVPANVHEKEKWSHDVEFFTQRPCHAHQLLSCGRTLKPVCGLKDKNVVNIHQRAFRCTTSSIQDQLLWQTR